VSGGVAGAEGGRLTVMVAGAPENVERARSLLELLGSTIFVVGERPGQGQTVKVINNLMSACAIAITSEAAALGVKAGLDPATLLEVVAASSGTNAAAAVKFPQHVLTRRFHQGFRLALMAKDVRLCLGEARRLGVPMLLGGTVEQLWSVGEASFDEDADFMEIVKMFEDWSGTRIESS
jgi:3-hydroxyisobutyrate dehydrogenase-like beta-hydroxyacid dehydrogenase